MYIIHNIFLKLGARYNMNVYVYKLGLSFKYWYLIYKIKIRYYYYVLRFVLPKLRIAGSKKFSSEGKKWECQSPMSNPIHVTDKFQITKNGPQKPSWLKQNLNQVGNKGQRKERCSSKAHISKKVFKAMTESTESFK